MNSVSLKKWHKQHITKCCKTVQYYGLNCLSVISAEIFYTSAKVYSCDELTNFDNKNLAVAEMDDRGHNRHGPQRGRLLCPFHGELIQCSLGRGYLPMQSIQPFGHNRHESKTGVCAPFTGEL